MKIPAITTAVLACLLACMLPSTAQNSTRQGRLAELRKKADTNGDGTVSEAERREAMRQLMANRIKGQTNEAKGPAAVPGEGEKGPGHGYTEGANCLFIGHSFFVPVAKVFDQLATDSGFKKHKAQTVFAPGGKGTPGQLWGNAEKKRTIEAMLATGKIEILGMTTIATRDGNLDDYRKWIDLALKYNPETRIMIGQAWMAAGTKLDEEKYITFTKAMGATGYEQVSTLRKEYPDKIYYNHYGHIGRVMKSAFHAGKLPDITTMVGKSDEALYTDDRLGHGGPLMHELCAITWAATLYQAELKDLSHSDFSPQAAAIAKQGIKHNQQVR